MEEIVLFANKREVVGKQVKLLRRQGLLPAVIYGREFEPISITLNAHDTHRALMGVTSSQLIQIDIDGKKQVALIRDHQNHPVSGDLLHIDFLAVSMTQKLRANVSIELVGDSPAVDNLGGILVTGLEQLEVECLPGDLPEKIEVDISVLQEIGDSVHVKDIPIPSGVEILELADEMIVLITAPSLEVEEEEEIEEEEAEEPEVIERGRKEEIEED